MPRSRADDAEFSTPEKKESYVRGMFDAISPRYDLLNAVVSLRMDGRWRRRAVDALQPEAGGTYVDVGTGTGDLALAILNHAPAARVAGVDIAEGMLALARGKAARTPLAPGFVAGSGIALPLRDASAEGVTNAFLLRNLRDLDAFFREAHRALKPGGRLVSLEIARPRGRVFGPIFRTYFYRVMPRVGRALSGNPEAYSYLAASVRRVEPPERLAERMRRAGFSDVRVDRLMRGSIVLLTAERAK